MRISNFMTFINESRDIKKMIYDGDCWIMSEDKITELFYEFIDYYCEVEVSFGFTRLNPMDLSKKIYSEIMSLYDNTCSYKITVQTPDDFSGEVDFNYSITFIIDMLTHKLGSVYINGDLFGGDSTNKIDLIMKNNNFYINGRIIVGDLEIIVFQRKTNYDIYLSPKEFVDYYNIKYSYLDNEDNVYLDLKLSDIGYFLIKDNSYYYKYLEKNKISYITDSMYDDFSDDFYSDTNFEFVKYILYDDNFINLLKYIVEKFDFDDIMDHFEYESVSNGEELVDLFAKSSYYSKEEFKNKILSFVDYHRDDFEDLILIFESYYVGGLIDDFTNKFFKSLDKIVGDNFNYTRFTNDDDEVVYRLKFDDLMYLLFNFDDYEDNIDDIPDSLYDLLYDAYNNDNLGYKKEIKIDDLYPDIDVKLLNGEIKSYLS